MMINLLIKILETVKYFIVKRLAINKHCLWLLDIAVDGYQHILQLLIPTTEIRSLVFDMNSSKASSFIAFKDSGLSIFRYPIDFLIDVLIYI